jgi:FkbM family methyltransferase
LKLLLSYDITPQGLLHIGANTGKEAEKYRSRGVRDVVFVEAAPDVFAQLMQNLAAYPGYRGIRAVCSDKPGVPLDFHVASNAGASSSFLGLGNHAKLYPDIRYVETLKLISTTADELAASQCSDIAFDMMVLDTQGSELHVLRGATSLLSRLTSLYVEVSEEPLYEGGCTFDEVMAFVRPFGFRLKHIEMNPRGWGNALFVNA